MKASCPGFLHTTQTRLNPQLLKLQAT